MLLPFVLTACGGGASSTPIGNSNVPPELLACRARIDSPFSYAEVALRSAQNLGSSRISDRSGTERHARLHPDGNTVVFARERSSGSADSQELFVAAIDGSRSELRLSLNNRRDAEPCWSPDGTKILFTSERDGDPALWLVLADGSDPTRFLSAPAGESDGQADWHAGSNRIVFSRRDQLGKHRLHLAAANGTGVTQLTDGGPGTSTDAGDHAPAFAGDGNSIVFVRRGPAGSSSLCFVDLASFTVTTRHTTTGELGLPRFAPTQDRVFFGLAEPDAGRATLRLASIPVAAGEPSLVWPDERWQLEGLDVLPNLPALPAASATTSTDLDVEAAQIQIAYGGGAFGVRSQLKNEDGNEFVVQTAPSGLRQVAGINCRFDLPVEAAEDVLELRVRAIARLLRADGNTTLRLSIYNPADERFDTVVELEPGDTAPHTLTFRTTSLRHVTRERQLRFTVIGDATAGDRTQLHVDLVAVELIARTPPP